MIGKGFHPQKNLTLIKQPIRVAYFRYQHHNIILDCLKYNRFLSDPYSIDTISNLVFWSRFVNN